MSYMECYDCKHVDVRKPHTCFLCGKKINAGEKAFMEKGKYEGEFFKRYTCGDCYPFSGDFWEYVDNESCDSQWEFREMLKEMIYDGKAPNHPLVIDIDCHNCGNKKVVADSYDTEDDADTIECPFCFAEAKIIK